MGSSRVAEQRVESTRINTPGVDVEGDAGKQGAGTSLAGEKKVRQQSVFEVIEKDLKEHDERERKLAEAYRVSEEEREERQKVQRKERKERQKAQRKEREERHKAQLKECGWFRRRRDGIPTSNPLESAPNPVGSAPNRVDGAPNSVDGAPNPVENHRNTYDADSCYIEIKNLVLIENSVIHKKALEEWDRREKLFASRVERKSTKVESRKNEVYNLIGFFSVFQGVVLTAVSQANLLHCNNLWSPILLSVLASIVTIAGVLQKLMQISALEETIFSESEALKDAVHRGQALRREGKDFVFAQFSECRKKESKKGYSTWYGLCVVGLLIVFTVAFPLSHWRILCDPGRNPYG